MDKYTCEKCPEDAWIKVRYHGTEEETHPLCRNHYTELNKRRSDLTPLTGPPRDVS